MGGRPQNPAATILSVRRGDAGALERLLDSYRGFLRLLARASLGGAGNVGVDASDIVQETLIRAHERFDQFRGTSEGELVAWLKRILSNRVVDAHRRHGGGGRALRHEASLDALIDRSSHALERLLPAGGPTPSHAAAARERGVLLAQALATLPPDQQEVVVLRSLHGRDWGDVGRLTGRTSDAARVMWGRAVRGLGRALRRSP
jgi:RNA polymerase sigma-70 factor (ECF subfamily)